MSFYLKNDGKWSLITFRTISVFLISSQRIFFFITSYAFYFGIFVVIG